MSQRTKRILFYISVLLVIALIALVISASIKTNKSIKENPMQPTVEIPKTDNFYYTKMSTKSWAQRAWLNKIDPKNVTHIAFISQHDRDAVATQAWVFDGLGCYYNEGRVFVIVGRGLKITGSMNGAFSDMPNLISITGLDLVDTSDVKDMSNLFSGCNNLQELNANDIECDNVILANAMFKGCMSLKEIDMSKVNMENAIEMKSFFSDCSSAERMALPKTRDVVSISRMFERAGTNTPFGGVKIEGELNTQNCNDMSYMFSESRIGDYSIVGTFNTENLLNAEGMFYDCAFKHMDLSSWNTTRLENAKLMFSSNMFLQSCNMNGWNMDSLKTCEKMFSYCSSLKTMTLEWTGLKNFKDASSMFESCYSIKTIDLSCFNNLYIGNTSNMFAECYELLTITCEGFQSDASDDTFKECVALKGSVSYSEDKIDGDMATTDGYFTVDAQT